jgi:hypothetical protein
LAEEKAPYFPHLTVRGRVENSELRRQGRSDPKIRLVERRAHGRAMKAELRAALDGSEEERRRVAAPSMEELNALGSIVVLEGADPAFPLKVDSLNVMSTHWKRPKLPQWLLLSVMPSRDGSTESAVVWVSDKYRESFMRRFERFLEKDTPSGNPRESELVANIGRIRSVVLSDLWLSAGEPPKHGKQWWEIWLREEDDAVDLLRAYAGVHEAKVVERALKLSGRIVAWVEATWDELQALPFTSVPVAEIRKPEFVETIEDLSQDEKEELATDLAARIHPAPSNSPAVCHLDTGIRRTHALLQASLDEQDVHSIVGGSGGDQGGHGTKMAGLALFGAVDTALLSAAPIHLRHRLESVKFLPDAGSHEPLAYGVVTAEAVAAPEATSTRQRVYCMPVTTKSDQPGEPSLWSAAVDALAAGADIATSEDGLIVLAAPDPAAARLIVISAGNVEEYMANYLDGCDLAPIEDPAHAWNALTVGAHTEMTDAPNEPSFAGWSPLAVAGDISPHSRTGVNLISRVWPPKPDICMEGGNVLFDGHSDFHRDHPKLSLATTDNQDDLALSTINATSAASAQAARLAALAQATYPEFWPETVKGLLVHSAEWTDAMRAELDGARTKSDKRTLLCRYGWGVPTEDAVLKSTKNAVTMVAQDEFVPFQGDKFRSRIFRLHRLPWPKETLEELGATDVVLRVTLAYFIEPTAARRGWRRRYAYSSHGLRFELKGRSETVDQFLARVNNEANAEEEGGQSSSAGSRWVLGKRHQQSAGSLHQDLWEGPGAELAAMGMLAVHPIGGWWKNNLRKDRIDRGVRYALITSLRTAEQGVDLYSPIAVQLDLPVETAVPAT